ncbi:MAG: tRNA 2-thiouridine(34) synthase MnmA [Desulfotignum sp.]|nr:tRNA 2-thiouridine(34) synthase MnmA [Desulfotignum sp.]MCF8112533.1 tRNA 2-thiouridine(34) synthase MnmA [Desulfotignum sp.]MCF8124739.1 tRNA 2-thiouridine(34) synthase MnmA [Desulfotignum sp.]
MKEPTIAVAVSGGVDSLISAFLLKQQYSRVFGLHFTTGYETRKTDIDQLKDQLKIDIITLDLAASFEQKVVQYFVSTYTRGKTPNPCMICNQKIKFGVLLEQARKLGADYLATGHYATIVNTLTQPGLDISQTRLEKGTDAKKDQSYFLARLSVQQLSRIICPLAGFTKDQVKALAARHHLVPVTAKESQDICFIDHTGFFEFIVRKAGIIAEPGPVVDVNGRQVGSHTGLHAFTVGQRRGINCPASQPYYVRKIDPLTNTLHVCFKQDLAKNEMTVEQMIWHGDKTDTVQEVAAKIRYSHSEALATLSRRGTFGHVRFSEPQYAVTPGQAAVFYRGRQVLGSAIIQ